MTRFVLALAFSAASASMAFAEIPDHCTPAQQNWVNASGYTCPVIDPTKNSPDDHGNYRAAIEVAVESVD